MENINILEKKLATVEMSFLEHLNAIDSYNSGLFDIFNWLDSMKKETDELKQIHFAVLNDEQIFYKDYGKSSIGIYENTWHIKPEPNQQLLVIIKDNKIQNQAFIIRIISSLLQFLTDEKIAYHDRFETEQTVQETWSIIKMIEVMIGAK